MRTVLVGVVLAVTVSSCSVVDAGLEQVAGAAEISLQTLGSLDNVPLLPSWTRRLNRTVPACGQ